MQNKYVVRLTAEERQVLGEVVRKLKGSSQKVQQDSGRNSPICFLEKDLTFPGFAFDKPEKSVLDFEAESELMQGANLAVPVGYAAASSRVTHGGSTLGR